MKILITGIEGQLGKALVNSKPKKIDIFGLKRIDFDLEDFNSCRDFIKNKKPNWIINTAAFTDVNKAELEQEKYYKVNSYGVENIVKALSSYGGKMIHISSDLYSMETTKKIINLLINVIQLMFTVFKIQK